MALQVNTEVADRDQLRAEKLVEALGWTVKEGPQKVAAGYFSKVDDGMHFYDVVIKRNWEEDRTQLRIRRSISGKPVMKARKFGFTVYYYQPKETKYFTLSEFLRFLAEVKDLPDNAIEVQQHYNGREKIGSQAAGARANLASKLFTWMTEEEARALDKFAA